MNKSKEDDLKEILEATRILQNSLEYHLSEEYQDIHILKLFERAGIILIEE